MESENQMENKAVMEEERALVVDLNRATAEELQAVPGIGPTLAERIITYRDTVQPFEEPIEIAAVPGISEKTYRAIADYLTVAPTESLPPPMEEAEEPLSPSPLEELPLEEEIAPETEAESSEEITEVMFLPLAELPPEEEVAPEAEAEPPEEATEVTLSSLEELPPTEEIAPKAEAEAPETPPPAPLHVAPAPPAPRRSSLAWFWSALLGGLLGMIFTLLVLSGINGSLDINHSPAILKVNNQMSSLAAEMDSLRGEIGGLRQRLDGLEGLTARMEQTELAVDDLRGEMTALEQQASALEEQANAISEDLTAIQGQTQQMGTFFQRLQALLNELFGEAEGTATPTPTPSQ
jgi:competence ComEA-like helix-hairpin-helix protein